MKTRTKGFLFLIFGILIMAAMYVNLVITTFFITGALSTGFIFAGLALAVSGDSRSQPKE